ncbi:MAG: response regulator [Candidatus Methanospirareceae archaeon]
MLVEDNPDDIMFAKMAFEKAGIKNRVYIVESGEEALDFLYKKGKYKGKNVPMPGLILLDLRLPGISGHEVLKRIKGDNRLKLIPVVVLTASEAEQDIIKAYSLGANSYITKPVGFKDFVKVIATIGDYWLRIAKIPPPPPTFWYIWRRLQRWLIVSTEKNMAIKTILNIAPAKFSI